MARKLTSKGLETFSSCLLYTCATVCYNCMLQLYATTVCYNTVAAGVVFWFLSFSFFRALSRTYPYWPVKSICVFRPDASELSICEHTDTAVHFNSVQFCSRWYIPARESPYSHSPISHRFPHRQTSNHTDRISLSLIIIIF